MAANKYLALISGRIREVIATVISAGAGSDGSLVALDSSGKLDSSVLPVGLGLETKSIVSSENLAAGSLVNIWDSAGTPKVRKADATSSGKEAVGFVLSGVTSPAAATVYFEGTITGLAGLVAGSRLYLSASVPGDPTTTAPSTSGNVVQYVGTAISTSEFSFEATEGVILA
jgi:hypothetical protein